MNLKRKLFIVLLIYFAKNFRSFELLIYFVKKYKLYHILYNEKFHLLFNENLKFV